MTIELKLDTHALNELFKDEQARLNLQQAVIENFMTRHIKSMVNGITNDPSITKAVREAQEEVTKQFFIVTPTKTNTYPFKKIEYVAKQEVLDQFTVGLEEHLSQVAEGVVKKALEGVQQQIEQQVQLAVSAAVRNYAITETQKQVSQAFDAFHKQLLDNIKLTS